MMTSVRDWFLRFSVRDQLALLMLGAALLLYLVFMVLVVPQNQAREEMRARNVATAQLLQRVDAMAVEIGARRAEGAPGLPAAGRNLSASLNASAERFKLRITRLQPNSRGDVQLRFESAPLVALLRWFYELEAKEGMRIEELSLSQTANPGIVSATVRVAGSS
jgi:type II secretory pathway component PulM